MKREAKEVDVLVNVVVPAYDSGIIILPPNMALVVTYLSSL